MRCPARARRHDGVHPIRASTDVWGQEPAVAYNRDIRPFFSETCVKCHGPDSNRRKAGLRLDQEESAFRPAKSGEIPIVPGDLEKSELIKRITARMTTKSCPRVRAQAAKPAEIAMLRQWIKEGAHYEGHWAFQKIQGTQAPHAEGSEFPIRNPIDAFVLARLEKEGLRHSAPEEKAKLIRR